VWVWVWTWAGKSTIMRSVCVVSLLGNCGLMVPAAAARVPAQDSFFLRAASFDSPADGLSAFAVEMLDIATMLRDASPATLVLVDELGRGTETRAGAALAGAVLEELVERGCRGIFTTHLHEMFELPLQLRGPRYLRMDVLMSDDGLSWRPTWRLAPGRCIDSLAVHAAQQCGLPPSTIARAQALASLGPERSRPAPSPSPSPSSPPSSAGPSSPARAAGKARRSSALSTGTRKAAASAGGSSAAGAWHLDLEAGGAAIPAGLIEVVDGEDVSAKTAPRHDALCPEAAHAAAGAAAGDSSPAHAPAAAEADAAAAGETRPGAHERFR